MATNAAQYSQISDFVGDGGGGGQYQPYPYASATYGDQYPSATYGDQYPSASLPQAQVQNFIQSPPGGGRNAKQPRFGERTVARTSGRQRKQQLPVGPIVAKDGAKPVVPLYSYQTLKNNTVVQVPLFWTALSIALGYQVQGDQVIRGLPCIKRLRQLFCTNAGSQYPVDRIESFINDNKALTRRMFGAYPPPPADFAEAPRVKRSTNETSDVPPPGSSRQRRQAVSAPPVIDKGSKHLVDSCESKVEIVTPYWAANSAGEIRAIVNTKHFPQAIHQEICKGTTTSRCTGNCLCEQKYTYHRLLSYDPDNDCKGIFIDWFLFPSCCACRCPP